MLMRSSFCRLVVPAILAALVALEPGVGSACMNVVQLDTSTLGRLVASAEAALEKDQVHKASSTLARLAEQSGIYNNSALSRRVNRVQALISLRMGYARSAILSLQRLLAGPYKGDPYLRARLAEAYSLLPRGNGRNIAKGMLEELEKSDLLPDAESYQLLATLRAEAGDKAGREQAIVRCKERVAKERVALCEIIPEPV